MSRVIVEARRFVNSHFPIPELKAESNDHFADHGHPVASTLSIRLLHQRAREISHSYSRRNAQADQYAIEAKAAVAQLREDPRFQAAMHAHPLVGNQYWLREEANTREQRARSISHPRGIERTLRRIL